MLYVLLIVVYAEVMDRLDRRWHALHAPDSLSPSELSRLHD
jgi:uncharacterized membrane protein